MRDTRVWICQCLCPARHTIMATAGEATDDRDAEEEIAKPLRVRIGLLLASGEINPWCGLCNALAKTWRYELGPTLFRSMDEATPVLRKLEADQAATRALFGMPHGG